MLLASFIVFEVAVIAAFFFCAYKVHRSEKNMEDLFRSAEETIERRLRHTFTELYSEISGHGMESSEHNGKIAAIFKRLGLDFDEIQSIMQTPVEQLKISKELAVKLVKSGYTDLSDLSVRPSQMLKDGFSAEEISEIDRAVRMK